MDATTLFYSGHSLTARPLPDDVAAIAASLGTAVDWNRQYLSGSSILQRSRGVGGWAGYRSGDNREGNGMDVLAELRSGATIGARRYEHLVITEQHGLLVSLAWNDSVRCLRHFHERFIDANPAGRTWFYVPWLMIDDKADPRRWIAYEREAAPLWQGIATRINASLALEGRRDRIDVLPASLALAELVERATQGDGLPGITAASVRETVDRLVEDDVHQTRLGMHFLALVSVATIFGRSPMGAWAPPEIDAQAARSLQQVAGGFVERWRAEDRPLSLDDCRARLRGGFIGRYAAYVRDVEGRQTGRPLAAWWRWAKHSVHWRRLLAWREAGHPLALDPATDRLGWLPPP